MLRNEGGSVGIAVSATVLARHAQVHHARLGEFVSTYGLATQQRLAETGRGLAAASGLDPESIRSLSVGMVEGALQRQAVVKAYVDVFWMLTFAFVFFLPFIFMLSQGDGKARGGH